MRPRCSESPSRGQRGVALAEECDAASLSDRLCGGAVRRVQVRTKPLLEEEYIALRNKHFPNLGSAKAEVKQRKAVQKQVRAAPENGSHSKRSAARSCGVWSSASDMR